MIAWVTCKFNEKDLEAIITDKLEWSCTNKLVESALELLCDPKDDGSSEGPRGHRAALKAAALLPGGVAHLGERPAEPKQVVY